MDVLQVTALKKTDTGVRGRLRLLGFLRLGSLCREPETAVPP